MIHNIQYNMNTNCEENIKNINIITEDRLRKYDSLEALFISLMKPFPKSGMRSPIGYLIRIDVENNMKSKKKISFMKRIMRWFK